MKKIKTMRIASILLIAVLMTTCAISGTFAKYVTDATGSDSARVAKWGVVIEVESFNIFATDYATDDANATFEGDYSVSGDTNLLAPGTSGKFADISISGTPEVAVAVAVEAEVELSDNWMVDGEFYCPIVVTVGNTEISGLRFESNADFANAIIAAIEAYSIQCGPGTNLATLDANFDIEWAWEFSTGEDADEKDTALGDIAEDLTFDISIEITVTQID